MTLEPPVALLDHRSDPVTRSVLEDWTLSHGLRPTRLGLALSFIAAADDAAAAAAAADDAADDAAAADAAAAAAAAADAADDAAAADAAAADAAADADDAAAADADDAAAAAAAASCTKLLFGEIDMHNGIKIVQVPGRYGYSVTRIGWLRRVEGDEWELVSARTLVRTSGSRTLDQLASHGPMDDHRMSDVSVGVEEIHRLVLRRSLPANEKAWTKHCPRPKDWQK